MQRKYIYIIVSLLTIVLVVSEHYFDLSIKNSQVLLEATTRNLEELNIEDINSELLYPLIIKNTQNDQNVLNYTYKISIDGISGAYRYLYNGEESYIVFNAQGEAQVTLNSNEEMILYEIPAESNYKVEQISPNTTDYTTIVDNKRGDVLAGTMTAETTILFENMTKIAPPVEKPEENKETPPEKVEENPLTSDNYLLAIFVLVFSIVVLFGLSHVKVKRFE